MGWRGEGIATTSQVEEQHCACLKLLHLISYAFLLRSQIGPTAREEQGISGKMGLWCALHLQQICGNETELESPPIEDAIPHLSTILEVRHPVGFQLSDGRREQGRQEKSQVGERCEGGRGIWMVVEKMDGGRGAS